MGHRPWRHGHWFDGRRGYRDYQGDVSGVFVADYSDRLYDVLHALQMVAQRLSRALS